MSFGSVSDGEIVGSEGEKATKTRPPTKDSIVDRRSRPRSPLSRSPRPLDPSFAFDGASDDYHTRQRPSRPDTLNYSYDGRQRSSRSDGLDYGQDNTQHHKSTHGSKRRYEEDGPYSHSRAHTDSRRFQVRYEHPDHPRGPRAHQQQYQDRDSHASGRDSHNHSSRHPTDYYDRAPPGKRHQSGRHRTRSTSPNASAPAPSGPGQALNDTNATPIQPDAEPPVVVVDEAKLIEERRKRREALRAKHRGQNTPLLQKVLDVTPVSQSSSTQPDVGSDTLTSHAPSSVDSRPDAVSTTASPSASQPASPASLAVFPVSNDEDLANPAQVSPDPQHESDGPSAADYDPDMDMQESKLRDKDVVTANQPPPQLSELKEFDMFVEDDDDIDMFAPEPSAGHKKDDGTQAVRIPEAKQLDRGLLDDWDDPEGYYRIILGELLDDRYHVQTNLGKGVFSAVVRALDTKTDRLVAIKVIRKQESMYKAGMKEIEILQTIAEADPDDKKHLIRLERHFEHKGHLCMVFENLSINLREVLKKFGRDIGINIKAVRSYAQQMFLGLSLLRKCEILHADLKPDNVLVNETRSLLKIADLGSAMSARDNEVTDMLVSRFYRAPEIMLGIKHDYAIDMWSVGCTLFELYTGKICFTGPTNNQMLKVIMECRGKVTNRMLKRSEFWAQHFDPDGTFLSQETDTVTRKELVRRINITRPNPSKELRARLFSNAKGLSPADAKELNSFADLLDKCLALDPAKRITPTDALKHGFITRVGLTK